MLTGALIMLGLALAFVVIQMTLTWGVARRLRNYSIVDAVWSLGFAPIAALYLLSRKYQPEQSVLFVFIPLLLIPFQWDLQWKSLRLQSCWRILLG